MIEIILVFTVLFALVLLGTWLAFTFKQSENRRKAEDALRRHLWEQGDNLDKLEALSFPAALKVFGLSVLLPAASYRRVHYLSVTTSNAEGETKELYACVTTIFDKEVEKIEIKYPG